MIFVVLNYIKHNRALGLKGTFNLMTQGIFVYMIILFVYILFNGLRPFNPKYNPCSIRVG